MGSLHHKPSQKLSEQQLFLFKQMIKKSTVTSPTVHYKFLEKIGEGSASEVYKAQFLGSGQYRVIKKVKKSSNVTISKQLLNQYQVLRQLDHPNIIKIYQMFQDEQYHYIVTQYLPGCDALEMLFTNKHVTEEIAFKIFLQTLLTLNYLHRHHMMHRDIKLQNIIYDQSSMCFKLIDFGSALKFTSSAPRERRCTGTINYIAPEVINKYYNMKCDVWSLGIMLYVLLSGNAPFASQNHEDIIQKTLKQPLAFKKPAWEARSKQVKLLISKMLEKNFQHRPGIMQILNDPWVSKNRQSQQLHKSQRQFICNCLQKLIKFSNLKIMSLQMGILQFMNYFLIKGQNQVGMVRTFLEIDSQNDGQLDEKEMSQAFTSYLGMPSKNAAETAANIMQKLDIDKSGFITYTQFTLGATDLKAVLTFQNICRTFNYFDYDNSKSISASQLQLRLGSHLDESHYARILRSFDQNKDSQMDLQEFAKMMNLILQAY